MPHSFWTKFGYFGHCADQPSGPHQPSSADNSSKQPKTKQQRFEVLKTSELEKFRQLAIVTKKIVKSPKN